MTALFVALIHYPVTDRNDRIVASAITSLDLHDIARSARTYGASAFFVVHPVSDQREFATRVIDHWKTGHGRRFDSRRREALDLIRIVPNLDEAIIEAERMTAARPTIVFTSARAPGGMEALLTASIAHTPAGASSEVERIVAAQPEIANNFAPAIGAVGTARVSSKVNTASSTAPNQQSPETAPSAAPVSYAKMRELLEHPDNPPVMLLFGTGFGMAPPMLERADLTLPPVLGAGEYNHLSVRAAAGIILDRLRGR